MDECDQANVLSDFYLGLAIRHSGLGAGENSESRKTCIKCGEPIPYARQKAVPGCMLCIRCQAELER
ncbi:MAG: TraR/DksA C4-type zinc finger protein [Candidatus Marinimicrobia bacterium]|jgi:phage/conjugal plasmid C-4 type zinc finger TraR family protein|nr:TraR/DksA C4-type zinc finger protein [Candidatus Neomarinimicrobiota bacterium]